MGKNKTPRILVIRNSAMGDVAMTVPVLLAFRRTYPEVALTVMTRSFFRPFFSDLGLRLIHPDFSSAHKGLPGIYRLYRSLREQEYTAVADLHHVLRTTLLKLFFSGSGIPFHSLDKGRGEKKRLIRGGPEATGPLKTTISRYTEVFAGLGYPVTVQDSDILPKRALPELLGSSAASVTRIGIAPFAAHKGKQYPLEMMEEVVRQLRSRPGHEIYLFGGPGEEATALQDLEDRYEGVVNLAGKMEFSEEVAAISNMELMIGMDSGNAHIAAMFGLPVLTLWGVTHPYAGFAPFGQPSSNCLLADRNEYPAIPTSVFGNKWPEGYARAITSITPDRVVQRACEILDQARTRCSKDLK